jgi:hypothetical protein
MIHIKVDKSGALVSFLVYSMLIKGAPIKKGSTALDPGKQFDNSVFG